MVHSGVRSDLAILHIEIFVTFKFDPSLISSLIGPNQINWKMISLQNCIKEIAETVDLTRKSRKKNYCMRFFFSFFFVGCRVYNKKRGKTWCRFRTDLSIYGLFFLRHC